jgi:hypothetical protein
MKIEKPKTELDAIIFKAYGGYKGFRTAHKISVPTMYKYRKDPLSMSVGTVCKLGYDSGVSIPELFKAINDAITKHKQSDVSS